MIQVPWLVLAPSAPAMLGWVTLAMVMLSTARKLAIARTMAPTHSMSPVSAGLSLWAVGALDMMSSLSGLAAQVDLGGHRQTNAQRMGFEFGGVEADAH